MKKSFAYLAALGAMQIQTIDQYQAPLALTGSPIYFPSISQAKRRLINRRLNKFPKRK